MMPETKTPQTAATVTPFDFNGAEVRVVTRENDPWFVLADVCRVLDIGNASRAASRLDEDERGITTSDTPSGQQQMLVINESGLYSLVLTSRKPEAKTFKKWVTSEVLPAIRKTGGYMVARPDETPEALALRALTVLQATVERQKAQIAAIRPKAEAHDLIAGAEGSLSITEAAKALQMQPKALFSYLRENRWIYKREGAAHWLGYQARVQSGDLVHKVQTVLHPDGNERIREQVRVTAKGVTKLAKLVGSACALMPLVGEAA
jgi:prophage antirepressor-like protein